MRNIFPILMSVILFTLVPQKTFAAASIAASGGGTKTVGQQFTVTVTASGDEFDSLQGTISVSGPVSIVSFQGGGATWLPGKSPGNGSEFVGIIGATKSTTVAKITLKGTKTGSGAVSVSGVKLARNGSIVGSSGSGTNFTINRAPTPPGEIKVSSSSHPDPEQSYEATKIDLSWEKPNGVTEFSYLLDQTADTTPPQQKTSSDTSTSYADKAVGTYYFHIRGKNGDGWGSTTHFKIAIKEPDAKVDASLAQTTLSKITKAATYKTDITAGTVSGITFSGISLTGYKVNLNLSPKPEVPDPAVLTTDVGADGTWKITIDTPIKSGFYIATAQGQLEKVLTPASEPVKFELTLAKGGDIRMLTDKDARAEIEDKSTTNAQSLSAKVLGYAKQPLLWITLFLVVAAAVTGKKVYDQGKSSRGDR
jgi:hypothetical protein